MVSIDPATRATLDDLSHFEEIALIQTFVSQRRSAGQARSFGAEEKWTSFVRSGLELVRTFSDSSWASGGGAYTPPQSIGSGMFASAYSHVLAAVRKRVNPAKSA